nr:response regulator [Roseospira visakhapatnamensis]
MLVDDQGALRGVRLDLARVSSGEAGDGTLDADADGAAPAAVGDGRVRVLLAEDEIEAAAEIAEYLRDLDYAVTMVEDAQAGLRALDEGVFDVIVSDVSMPGGGAATLLRAVEAGHPDLAVILVSGLALDHDDTRADLADMADAVLRKPFGLGQLRETLERVLAG